MRNKKYNINLLKKIIKELLNLKFNNTEIILKMFMKNGLKIGIILNFKKIDQ
jgi:hypothetical protein